MVAGVAAAVPIERQVRDLFVRARSILYSSLTASKPDSNWQLPIGNSQFVIRNSQFVIRDSQFVIRIRPEAFARD